KSTVTVTFGAGPGAGLLVLSAGRAPMPRSSSLSGSSGLASLLLSTARYNAKVSSRPYDVMSSHCEARPKSVDARNHRYLPLASHTGYIASARPSVTWCFSPVSTLATTIARYSVLRRDANATHFESGLHDGASVRSGTIHGSLPTILAWPVAMSITHTFRLVSV